MNVVAQTLLVLECKLAGLSVLKIKDCGVYTVEVAVCGDICCGVKQSVVADSVVRDEDPTLSAEKRDI